jgi:hypothetical protein
MMAAMFKLMTKGGAILRRQISKLRIKATL